MTTYIALLRGINVGGKNRVKMAALKQMFERLGACHIQTYIQSGNVVFKSPEGAETLRQKTEQEFEETFGFSVMVVMRAVKELEEMIQNCPFSTEDIEEAEAASEAESLYVAFLLEVSSEEGIAKLSAYRNKQDKFQIKGQDVFLLFHRSIRDSKLANNLHKLNVPMTVRNWKTINKLVELAQAME